MIDIANSLKTGIMDYSMRYSYCLHYCVHDNEENVIIANPYYYISRYAPFNLQQLNDKIYVQSICKYKLQDIQSQFIYEDKKIPIQYYWVTNPANPGVIGMSQKLSNKKRIMITSGMLSGCGFAVLTTYDNKVCVIHAGASERDEHAVDIKIRRQKTNRDIFLMAMALQIPENYADWINEMRDIDINNGLTCEELFRFLQMSGFRGFIYVNMDNDQLICDKESMRLAVRAYSTHIYHDVVAIINENGFMSSTFRMLECEKDTRVVDSIQNQLAD